jgi:hypothetical protein
VGLFLFIIIYKLSDNIGMIYIEQGVINQIVLTLTEVTTVPTPHYLFAFTNEMNTTSSTQLFTTADTSLYPERYNLFVLNEPVDITLLQGQFIYQIYQSSVPYVLPLTIAQTTGVVIEEGRMVVSGPVGTSIYD